MADRGRGPGDDPTLADHPWTAEATDRLWEHLSASAGTQEQYFSRKFKDGLVAFLRLSGHLAAGSEVLDYGCGPGYLIEGLLEAGCRCSGVDRSVEAVNLTNRRLEGRSGWRRAVVRGDREGALQPGTFDLITCVEIVEHLDGQILYDVLADILALLRPGGTAFFATPHDEDLGQSAVFCPFCSTEFHPMQHVRSFSRETLAETLRTSGFEVRACLPTNLAWFQMGGAGSPLDWSPRIVASRLRRRVQRALDRAFPRPFPHGREISHWTGEGPHLTAFAVRPD